MNLRQQFLQYLAPTSFEPLALHIQKAQGAKLYDEKGKAYIDLIGGISVCNVGHSHPEVVKAIQEQAEQYMHIMVYGELVQSPQVNYAKLLCQYLDSSLNSVYFTNSGAEAVDGAMKLAKRVTGKTDFISCRNSYHGSSQGALSLLGDEYFKNAYRPLLPNCTQISFNNFDDIRHINQQTAAIFLEPVQAEAGVYPINKEWLQAIHEKCKSTGTLLVLDEIQTGFGRTGNLFAHQGLDIVPDVLLLGKALGGGLPLGAFIANKNLMETLAHQPILGHITTFGGNPVCCAAGKKAFEILLTAINLEEISLKKDLFIENLQHPKIKEIRHAGLMLAVQLESFEYTKNIIQKGLQAEHAIFTDWFLFASDCLRIVPPLNISDAEILIACQTICEALSK